MRKLFSFTIIFILLFLLVAPSEARAVTIGPGTYIEDEALDRTNLGYGISYYKSIGRTSSTVRSSENNQTAYYLNAPSTDAVRVISWANFVNNKWKLTTVRELARDFEAKNPGWQVIAATNGDFFDINATLPFPRQTSSGVAYDGNFFKTGGGTTLGFTNDGSEDSIIWANNPGETDFILDILDENKNVVSSFPIKKNNAQPGANETAVYYGLYNSSQKYDTMAPNITTLAKFYVEEGDLVLPNSANDFYGLGVITATTPEIVGEGQFAIYTNNQEVVNALAVGKKIRVQKKWTGTFKNVNYATGCGGTLIDNGVVPSNVNSTVSAAHPRTAIGRKADGSIVMAVVDGRVNLAIAAGAYGDELAAIMANAGCVEAYNLDGGGSSTLVIREDGVLKTVNVPSDGWERTDANAILVVTRKPEIEVQVSDATDKTLSLTVNVIDIKGHPSDALYANMNGEDVEVINGKVNFSGLRANTEYTCRLFYKLGTRKIEFEDNYKFSTTVTPHLFLRVDAIESGVNFNFEVKYRDRDEETNLPVADLIVNGKTYKLVDGKLSIPISTTGPLETLKIKYVVTNSLGVKTIIITNPDSVPLQFIDELLNNNKKLTKFLFK